MKHDFCDGKYTVINDGGILQALRHGEPWGRDLVGDNLVYWMLVEVDRLKAEAATLKLDADRLKWMQFHGADAAWGNGTAYVPLTDEQIEVMAIEHEAFGFGRVDAKGLTTHGFDPDGLKSFFHAVERAVRGDK